MAKQWIKIGNISGGETYIGVLAKSDSLKIEKEVSPLETINKIAPIDVREGKLAVSGDIEIELTGEDGIGELLYAFFGQVSTTDNGDGSYTHEFTLKDADIPELTVIKQVGGIQEKYEGMKVKTINIKAGGKGDLTCSVSLVGKTGSLTTGEAEATYDTAPPLKIVSSTATWGGTDVKIGNVELSIERDIADDGYLLNGDPGRSLLPEGRFKGTVKIDVLADDDTIINDFMDGVKKEFKITLVGETIDGSSHKYTLEFTFPNAVITSREKPTDVANQLLIENVEILALDDGTSAVKAKLTNSIDAYPRT
ncbi:MAG: hypothetical protein H0Z19_10010 [Archaeoglobus sp.]|uniref:phage tail tube protein n=2 Tax=Archaeoglobus sp. TaxID=1872626 RepID=UPI001D25143B|nr:phage tail tube protein [Archaeoglobus sp.]MBO8180790.1 hypothetical protein [Archaeoglobus sp.]